MTAEVFFFTGVKRVRGKTLRGDDGVIAALVAAYHQADTCDERDRRGHRSGVRCVAVQLGLYDQFCAELDKQ